MKLSLLKFMIVLMLSAVAFAQTKPAASPAPSAGVPSEQTVNDFLRHMFGYDAALQWKVTKIGISPEGMPEVFALVQNGPQSQTVHFFIAPDGNHAIIGDVVPFGADPFAPARAVLAKADGPARGPAAAAVTIVEFGDLQCPSCKQTQPIIDKLIADNPGARFVFENFPLVQIHPWAFKASSYADCVARADGAAFWKFMQGTYEVQETVTVENADAKLTEVATKAGVDGAKAATCAATPETKARVEAAVKLGLDAGVTGTPTLFINGRKISNVAGMPYDYLNKLAKFSPEAK